MKVEAGDPLTEGNQNPHEILQIKGIRAVQDYMLKEVQRVYRRQGVEINDKHIEVIVRRMLRKVHIEEKGDSDFLPGSMVDVLDFEDVNEELAAQGKEPSTGTQIMLGITKASLATDSFLSAASFQETTKVLTDAAIKGKVDHLIGLKENVIIGKLIPAGTGLKIYQGVELDTAMPQPKKTVAAKPFLLPEDEKLAKDPDEEESDEAEADIFDDREEDLFDDDSVNTESEEDDI